jgi:hypothetical protein
MLFLFSPLWRNAKLHSPDESSWGMYSVPGNRLVFKGREIPKFMGKRWSPDAKTKISHFSGDFNFVFKQGEVCCCRCCRAGA